MSLEKEIVVVIPMQAQDINMPKKHREVLIFDEVFNDLDKSEEDSETLYWDLGLTTYNEGKYTFYDYKDMLPYVKNSNLLKDYFELGKGKRIRLVNVNLLNDLIKDKDLLVDTLEERILFLKGIGSVVEQYKAVEILSEISGEIDKHLILLSSVSSLDYLGKEKDKRIVHILNTNDEHDPYLTYFSYYNANSENYLKNEYQVIDSLSNIKTTSIPNMQNLWLNNQTSFIELEEAQLKVFANVVNTKNEDVNNYFIEKDMTVDIQNQGLKYLALGDSQRRYTNNNINNLAVQFDNVLLKYREKNIIESFNPTTWVPVADQTQEDIQNKEVKGFVCQYFLADEIRNVEVSVEGSFNIGG